MYIVISGQSILLSDLDDKILSGSLVSFTLTLSSSAVHT